MRDELEEFGLFDCHGWAYDSCGEPAVWLMIEQWPNGSAVAHGLCRRHCRSVFADSASEHTPPICRTWWKLQDFAEFGFWPTKPPIADPADA